MEDFSFTWRYKDFEIRTAKNLAGHPYVELVKWEESDTGRRSCFALAYFYGGKDGSYELHFVGDRPLMEIAEIDLSEIWRQLWFAQMMFEDAKLKMEAQ